MRPKPALVFRSALSGNPRFGLTDDTVHLHLQEASTYQDDAQALIVIDTPKQNQITVKIGLTHRRDTLS